MTRYSRLIFFLAMMLVASFSYADKSDLTPPGLLTAAQDANAPTRLWNFQNADIRTVINEVAKETHKNFLVDPRVQGKVTLVSSVPITASETYQMFLTMLQTQGFAAIPNGNIVKIVPDTVAKFQEIPTLSELSDLLPSKSPELVVKVIPIQNINAAQLIPVIQPMLPPSNQISVYNQTNSLIIAASANKLTQIEQVINQLDQPSASNIEIVSLKYATATQVATTLKSLLPPTSPGQALQIAADSSSNSILINGTPQDRQRLRQLVQQMDSLASNTATMNSTAVVYLKYLKAKDFAPILQAIVTGQPQPPATSSSTSTDTSTSDQNSSDNSSNTSNTNNYGNNLLSNLMRNNVPATAQMSTVSSYSNVSTGAVNGIAIQAEPDVNAIIITAPPSQITAIKSLITKLDTRPQEVLVESIIAEVSDKTIQQLGIEWGTLAPSGTNLSLSGSASTAGATLSDDGTSAFSTIAGGLGVGIVDSGRIKTVIHALEQDSSTNILSTPSLVVLDNQKANIKVGQKVSFVTGQYANTNNTGTVSPFTTTDREDVALTLNVTPQINPNGSIILNIDQGNQTLSGGSVNGNPTTNESNIKTSVIINSGETLVIGGLIDNNIDQNVSKVPVLGDIPFIGQAFQYHSNTDQKKNLLVFLRPVIMNDACDQTTQTSNAYNYIRNIQLENQKNATPLLIPGESYPVLPKLQPVPQLPVPFSPSTQQ